jgi:hypothetical protein
MIWPTPQWVEAISTAVYALVTIGGLIYIIRQIRVLRRQNEIAKTAANAALLNAEAAKQSADALVASERARVIIELLPVYTQDSAGMWHSALAVQGASYPPDVAQKGSREYFIRVTNMGKTAAHLLNITLNYGPPLEKGEFSKHRLSGMIIKNLNKFLASREQEPLETFSLKELFAESDKSGQICITIPYNDILVGGKDPHETFTMYSYNRITDSIERITTQDRYT